jgi:glycosyltransferase involved in cell wall biosynthesis
MRVAFLTNIVSPYRAPVFRRLSETPGWEFRVFVNAEREHDRRWRFDLGDLPTTRVPTLTVNRTVTSSIPVRFEQKIALHIPWGLWGALRSFKPDVVVTHELGARSALGAAYAKAFGVPLVIWAYQSRVSASQGGWRQFIRRRLLDEADAVVGMGQQARHVLEAWGTQPAQIIDAPNAADHVSLTRRMREPTFCADVAALRHRLGGGAKLALVSGRLIPLKGVREILDIWRRLPAGVRAGWRLVFAGAGPLEALVREAASEGAVLAGEIPVERIADVFVASDLHVFPSLGDVWGLVVNEAMHCGVPTVCSVHAGCVDDLIDDSVTGLRFDPTTPLAASRVLAEAMTRTDRAQLADEGRKRIQGFSLDGLAVAFRQAVDQALSARCVEAA